MGRYTGPRVRVMRALGAELPGLTHQARENAHVKAAIDDTSVETAPWLEVDEQAGSFKVASLPDREATPVQVDIQKVVEYYAVSL